MAKDKYDFIQELLENKKLQPTQKERVLLLAKEEIKKDGALGKELEERVKKLEEMMNNSNDDLPSTTLKPIEEASTEEQSLVLPKYIPSKNLWKFLKDYNLDPILRTTCHEIDTNEFDNILEFCDTKNYDFIKHKEKVQEQYKLQFFDSKNYFVDYKIKNLILYYLTGKTYTGKTEGLTDGKIKFSWESEELKNWSIKNPNKVPHPNDGFAKNQISYGYELESPININLINNNQQIRYFSEFVLFFKHLFHVKSDNSLKNIIENCNNSEDWENKVDFKISKNFPSTIEFFTNIEKLVQAYRILINLIVEVSSKNVELKKPNVELKLNETETGVEFSIHHTNTVFQKTIQNTIDRKGSTFTNLIKNQLNGMCEFFVKACFEDGKHALINIWDGKNSDLIPSYPDFFEGFEGVEYILKFNKK